MKKVSLVSLGFLILLGCRKNDIINPLPPIVNENLTISKSLGIKLETPFVTSEVSMNVKLETAQTVTIKIFDIGNRVVSKETVNVVAGDNILKLYTTALTQ